MSNRRRCPRITIQQILNICSTAPEESISIKGIIAEFKKIKISIGETAVYHRIHRMEGDGRIQTKNKDFGRRGRVGRGPHEYFLTEKGLAQRDTLNTANPPPPKQEVVEEPLKLTSETGIRSIRDYLQMPITKPSE